MIAANETARRSRLSILHLMGAITCIAIYLVITRTVGSVVQPPQMAGHHFLWVLNSIGSGAALGGLLLLLSRRIQGLAFPNHPGEWLWILIGVRVVLTLAEGIQHALLRLAVQNEILESSQVYPWLALSAIFGLVVNSGLYLLCLVRVDRRWRVFFVTAIVMILVELTVGLLGMTGWQGYLLCRSTVVLVLVAVVIADVREGKERPWTHWSGVFIHLWFFGFLALSRLIR